MSAQAREAGTGPQLQQPAPCAEDQKSRAASTQQLTDTTHPAGQLGQAPDQAQQQCSMQIDSQLLSQADGIQPAPPAGRKPAAKRGRPSKEKQPTPNKKPCPAPPYAQGPGPSAGDLLQQQAAAAAAGLPAGSAWTQVLLQQQQQLLSFVAGAADPASKQHKQPKKPPKTAGQQQGKQGEACCFSLERPFGGLAAATGHHSLMPPGFAQKPQAAWVQQQQHGSSNAADMRTSQQGQPGEASTDGDSAALKTRLSARSVAYIEDLLQQTAQAAGRPGAGGSGSNGQPAPQARPAPHKGTAVTSRLSVGNLLISPPMSRAASTCINPLPVGLPEVDAPQDKATKTSPGKLRAPAAAGSGPQQPGAASAGADAAAADARLPLSLAFPQPPCKTASSGGSRGAAAAAKAAIKAAPKQQEPGMAAASNRTSTNQLLAANMAALEQQQQLAAAAGLLPVPSAPASRRSRIGIPQLQAAVAAAAAAAVAGVSAAAPPSSNPDSPANAQRKLPTAAEINRAAAAAVAAFQLSAAAAAAARGGDGSSSDTSSSGEDGRAAMDPAVWTAYTAGIRGSTPDGAGKASTECRGRLRVAGSNTVLSDSDSPPSSPDSPGSAAMLGVFAGPAGATGAAGMLLGASSKLGGLQAGVQERLPLHARKSDRQVGLETVSRIDAIFQQLRSLQPPLAGTASNPAVVPPAAAEARAASQGPSRPDSGGATQGGAATARPAQLGAALPACQLQAAAAGGAVAAPGAVQAAGTAAEVMGCSVAALCRGLRYDGDITLKEVAMAFQLRDAYDWDEDLEATAAQEVRQSCMTVSQSQANGVHGTRHQCALTGVCWLRFIAVMDSAGPQSCSKPA